MQPLQQTLPAVLADILRRAPLSPEKVTFAWRTAVGPAIARATTVRLSEDGVIEVQCADQHWRREIRRSAPIITGRLIALLGADVIKQVKVPGVQRTRRSSRQRRSALDSSATGAGHD